MKQKLEKVSKLLVLIENVNYEDTLKSVERSLQRLDMDYIDLVLIHQPYNKKAGN